MTTAAKLTRALAMQTSTALKVLDAVPFGAAWRIGQIVNEMNRIGTKQSHQIVQGCLYSLRDDGLVTLTAPDFWQRVQVEPEPERARARPGAPYNPGDTHDADAPPSQEPATVTPIRNPAPKPVDPLDVAGAIAAGLRAQAAELQKRADEIEAMGLAMAAEVERARSENADVQVFRAQLSKFLTGGA